VISDTETELWVIDTSSIIQIKQVVPRTDWKTVFGDLSNMVSTGSLVFPKQVVGELANYKVSRGYDRPYDWAKKNEQRATRHGELFAELTDVMSHPIAKRVCDVSKAMGPEEADPYVLALAMHLKKDGQTVTVLAEESKSTPHKLAIGQACGALRLYSMKIDVFLIDRGIYPTVTPPSFPHGPTKRERV
jgi:Domain of unknown function (DUF4411)